MPIPLTKKLSTYFGDSLRGLILHWQNDYEKEFAGKRFGGLGTLVCGLPNLNRLSVWFNRSYTVRPNGITLDQFCAALNDHQALRWLDLNFDRDPNGSKGRTAIEGMKPFRLNLSRLLPRLERLTLGCSTVEPITTILANAAPKLRHLGLDCQHIYAEEIEELATQNNGQLAKSVTSLALHGANAALFREVGAHFSQLKSLKLETRREIRAEPVVSITHLK